MEVVVVVDEVNLHACSLDGGHFDDERMVGVVNHDVQTRKADDFVELVTSFVDVAPLGHECADFSSSVLNGLREFSSSCCHGALWNVRQKFLIDEENLFSFRHFLCEYIFTAKLRKKMDMRGY